MFWRIPNFSATSPVETILDKENFTLEDLLDEEEIIQECKALNTRLINFLRDRAQVEQLLQYLVEDAPEDAESKRTFKFPFIACEIFTCEIDVILKTLVEDEELMNMLFSFLEPNRSHSSMLAGYFSKVVVCLMLRKTTSLMNYVQTHRNIFQQLVDLIGITSMMEILIRLVGGDDHMYPNFLDVMQWLADSDLLEMIVDKLSPSSSLEVHANAAEVLLAIIRSAPSALAAKLGSSSFVARILGHALEDASSKSALVHSLSVCIYLLDPKRSTSTTLVHPFRSQHLYEPPITVDPETTRAMLPKLGDLLELLNVSADVNILPTTYGELRPPLGNYRLKIVEFITVLLGTGDETTGNVLISLGAIQRILDLFFEYPFNNSLHHHVESIVYSCLESNNTGIIDHLFRDCNIILRFLQADKNPIVSIDMNPLTRPIAGRQGPRAGNIGHITRIANKLVHMSNVNDHIRAYLQESGEWADWQTTVLDERNAAENVYHWACGRPTGLQERTRDSDEDELQDRDFDVTPLADNLNQAFRYCTYENDDVEEDVYFNDESAEVVISSLRLGDDSESSLFTNSNWFAFQDDKISKDLFSTSTHNRMDDTKLDETADRCTIDDEGVVVGEDGASQEIYAETDAIVMNGTKINGFTNEQLPDIEKVKSLGDMGLFQFEMGGNDDLFNDQQLPEWVGWHEPCDIMVDESPGDHINPLDQVVSADSATPNDTSESGREETGGAVPSLFEKDAEFVGVELEGMGRAMHLGSKCHITRELKKPCQDGAGLKEFNEKNPWQVEPEVGVVQE